MILLSFNLRVHVELENVFSNINNSTINLCSVGKRLSSWIDILNLTAWRPHGFQDDVRML